VHAIKAPPTLNLYTGSVFSVMPRPLYSRITTSEEARCVLELVWKLWKRHQSSCSASNHMVRFVQPSLRKPAFILAIKVVVMDFEINTFLDQEEG
jgi:hypothetical protein